MRFKFAIVALSISLSTQANFFKASDALNKNDYSTAKVELQNSAHIGHAEAQFLLGLLHYQGKDGGVDKLSAMAWFFMAAEYEYPNAAEYARQIYQELSEEDKAAARTLAADLKSQYGMDRLDATIYPESLDKPAAEQVIKQPAKMLKRGYLEYKRGNATAKNMSAISKARTNSHFKTDLSKMLVKDDTGTVVIQYDVASDGKTRDAEVLFSWPRGRFDKSSLSSVENSTLTRAKNNDDEMVEQYGKVATSTFGYKYSANLKYDYPHQYKTFKKLRKQAEESPKAKYIYASFLRAYQNFLPDNDVEAFESVLLDSAEKGYAPAQLDYALYQLYQNNEIETGLEWLVKAAKSGFNKAEYKLGDILHNSPSPYIKHDNDKAIFWLDKAAENGHIKGQQKLTALKVKESRLDEDYTVKAIAWLEATLEQEQGTPDTHYLLAKLYHFQGDKEQAEGYLDEAIKSAKVLKWNVEQWEEFKQGMHLTVSVEVVK